MEPGLPFDVWKAQLREDCARLGKLTAFSSFSDHVLTILWKHGTQPSVEGIVKDGKSADGIDF